MNRVAMKFAGDFAPARRMGRLCALALLAAANLAVYLFCDSYLDGLRQWIVEVPLHLLVLMAAQHVLFESGQDS